MNYITSLRDYSILSLTIYSVSYCRLITTLVVRTESAQQADHLLSQYLWLWVVICSVFSSFIGIIFWPRQNLCPILRILHPWVIFVRLPMSTFFSPVLFLRRQDLCRISVVSYFLTRILLVELLLRKVCHKRLVMMLTNYASDNSPLLGLGRIHLPIAIKLDLFVTTFRVVWGSDCYRTREEEAEVAYISAPFSFIRLVSTEIGVVLALSVVFFS